MKLIHLFPEKMHGKIKWIHRNVRTVPGAAALSARSCYVAVSIWRIAAAWIDDILLWIAYNRSGPYTCRSIQGEGKI